MYNLVVSGNENAWEGDPIKLKIGRCVREYTDEDVTAKFGDFTRPQIKEIQNLYSIFAYENHIKDPKLGRIKNIYRGRDIKIEYEIIELEHFLSKKQMADCTFDLDIKNWEMSRTHWAIKDIDLEKKLRKKGIHLPPLDLKSEQPIRVFLCHAAEDKPAVLAIKTKLNDLGIQTWIDKENLLPGQAWGIEIPKALKESDFALVFLSQVSVAKKGYVQREFRLALDIMEELPEGRVFLIPIKLNVCDEPQMLSHLHWTNLYDSDGFDKIISALKPNSPL